VCGRVTSTTDPRRLAALLDAALDPALGEFVPRFNLAPESSLPALFPTTDGRRLGPLHWGLTSPVGTIINARSESVAEKPTFRPMLGNRCVVPIDGYFEWEAVPGPRGGRGRRLPHYVTATPGGRLDHGGVLLVAGLWRRSGARVDGVLLTRDAAAEVRHVHDRMPVLLDVEETVKWLSGAEPHAVVSSVVAHEYVPVREHRVDVRVNDARHEGPDLIDPAPPETLF